jgi:hypothetical protein
MPTENTLTPSLPEVKRWQLKGFIPGVEGESKAVFRPVVVLADDFDRIAAERDALQLRLNAADQRIDELTAHRLVEPAIYQKPIDYWEGYGYIDRSCHIELRKMVDHLENLLDAIPEGPLYRCPPEQFEPLPGYPPVPDDSKLNPAKPQ